MQDNLKWKGHMEQQTKKCNKRLFLLRQLNNIRVDSKILALYYNSMIASVLTYVICSWFKSCDDTTLRALSKVEKRASRMVRKQHHDMLLSPSTGYRNGAMSALKTILADETHPLHAEFVFLPHGVRLTAPRCRTERYRRSPVPSLIRLYNDN